MRDAILKRADAASEHSVFGHAFADCFIDRLTEALYHDAWTPLATWLDATYRMHADSASRSALFTAAPLAVCETLFESGDAAAGAREQLERIAREMASITENATPEEADGRSERLDETDVLIGSLIGELSAIDRTTADNSRAVSAWCGRIAVRMGLAQAAIVKVTRGGLVRDVGKIATPQDILKAARALNDDEWEIMRDHVLAGERMVLELPPLRQFSSIVRSHHERFDGLGYPDGLDRGNIPIGVRIVSVADAFNAMIGARPYGPSLSPHQVIEELKSAKGSQFDPAVVDAMIEVALHGANR